MNTENLIKKSIANTTIQKEKGILIFERVFEIIKESVLKDKQFHIVDFGIFEIEHREMRTEIDYFTKSGILKPPKDIIKFTPLSILENNNSLNRLLLIRTIADEFLISDEVAFGFIKNIFDTILRALSYGKNVNIADFGKFIIRNNKTYFSPVKRFAQEINYNYAGLETIKIRNYNEKEFREKINRLKKIEEEIEVQLGGDADEVFESDMHFTEPRLPEKQKIEEEKFKISEDKYSKELLPEETELIPENYINYNIFQEEDVSREKEITEQDIEEVVNSAFEEFLKLNFPGKEETTPYSKVGQEKKTEEKEELPRTLSEFLSEDKITPKEIIKDSKETETEKKVTEKPVEPPEDIERFIIQQPLETKEEIKKPEEEIENINQIIKEPETEKKEIIREPAELPEDEDIERFIIQQPLETREEIKKPEEEIENINQIIKEPEAEKKEIIREPEQPFEDIEKFIIEHTLETKEEIKKPEAGTGEIIPGIHEEKTEQQKESPEDMKGLEEDLSKKIEEAIDYKNKVFNKVKLDELIAEREKIIREIKLKSDYTIEPYRTDEPDEQHREIEKDDNVTGEFKNILIPEQESGPEEPVKYKDFEGNKITSESDIDALLKEREKIIREIEKSSDITAETFKTKTPGEFTIKYPSEEKKTEDFENFIIPASKTEPQEDIKDNDISENIFKPALTYDEILEEREKFLEQEYKNPEMTVFKLKIEDTGSESEIDEHLAYLDKIKDNLKIEEPATEDYIVPGTDISSKEFQSQGSEVLSGKVKELNDEISKPVHESIPENIKNFDDVFIEDNKMIFYNAKENKAAEEMYKKANLKRYDEVFFRFESDKKSKKTKKSKTKKESNFLLIGIIWFVIIAALLTILALIFR